MPKTIEVTDDLQFSSLKLQRDPDGAVSFDVGVIKRICAHNGLPAEAILGNEDAIAELLNAWYRGHIENGGQIDTVMEDLITEARAENALGGGFSYPPGNA